MKRSTRFFVGLATAAVVFGSLFAFVDRDYKSHRHGCHQHNADSTEKQIEK